MPNQKNSFGPMDEVEKETKKWLRNGAKFLLPFAITALVLKLVLGYIDSALSYAGNAIMSAALPDWLQNSEIRCLVDVAVLIALALLFGALATWGPTRKALGFLVSGIERVPLVGDIFRLVHKLTGGKDSNSSRASGVPVLIQFYGQLHLALATSEVKIDDELHVSCVVYSNPPTGWQVCQVPATQVRLIADMGAGEVIGAGITMGTALKDLRTKPYLDT